MGSKESEDGGDEIPEKMNNLFSAGHSRPAWQFSAANRMQITVQEIVSVFDDLSSGAKRREEVSEWALKMMQATDLDLVEFIPAADKERLWKALIYFTGIDLKTSSDAYLHNGNDIADFRRSVNL